jgi:hypothetical protein
MAEEINEGVAYLRALRQATHSQAACAAVPAPEDSSRAQRSASVSGNANLEDSFKSAERRHNPRYKCEGSVELREAGCDVRTFASITDISLGGCYIEAQATYPVGTFLHLKLQANGFKVETEGSVRVNYPYLGMGLAFVDMSEENREHLKQLLCAVAQPCAIMGPGIAPAFPTAGPLEEMPAVSNPEAAIRALVEYFENRQMLMREDFLRILRASPSPKATP